MKRFNVVAFLAAFLFGLSCVAQTTTSPEEDYTPGNIILMLNEGEDIDKFISNFGSFQGVESPLSYSKELSKLSNIHLLTFDHQAIDDHAMLDVLRTYGGVRAVQFDHFVYDRAVPNDPSFGSQWHHIDGSDNDIDTDLAWDITTGGTTANGDEIVVCVIEGSGSNYNHTDLIANHWTNSLEIDGNGIDDDGNGYIDDVNGWNSGANNDNVGSGNHGTAVSGMIGARGNNSLGGAGVNWDVKIMQVDRAGINESNVIAAYAYPHTMRDLYNTTGGALGAFVVATNASWGIDGGNPADYPVWCAYYDDLGADGLLNCGATANNNVNIDVVGDMPTACSSDYMVSVTATNSSDVRTFSGYGATTIDLGAPGEAVFLPDGSSGYASTSGTSFASPCVAGAIALAYSIPCTDLADLATSNPQAAADQVRAAILNGVDPVANLVGECVTGGRLNARNTIDILLADCGVASCVGCADNCLNIDMTDGFGDGWNGAVWEIYNQDDVLVDSGTLSTGLSGSDEICLPNGCYYISVGGGSFDSEIGWTLIGVDAGSISGGAPSTVAFAVNSSCGGCTDAVACNFNPWATFNNGSCCYNTCVTLDMTDSFGDGWNGATYTLIDFNSGFVLESGTLTTGTAGSEVFCLVDGCYKFEVGGGSFDSEIGWTLTNVDGGPISGGAPSETTFTIGGSDCFGCTDSAACNYEPGATVDNGSCCYTNCLEFELTDSFGDGWNGAEYSVYDENGFLEQTGTMATGSVQIQNLCLDAGCYSLVIGGGSFDSEIGWTINGTDQGDISGGAPGTTYFSVGGVVCSGCTDAAACDYNPIATTNTGCCYDNCVSIIMTDSFGDGWNGAEYDIYNNNTGQYIQSGGLGSGSEQIEQICLSDGCYTLYVGGGSFDSEIGWTLTGTDGPESGGSGIYTFTIGGVLCDGCTDEFACNYSSAANTDNGTCCYQNCVTAFLFDGFGDGWDDTEWTIYDTQTGQFVQSGTLVTGIGNVSNICLPAGCYSFEVGGGSFDSETSFELTGVDDGTLTGDGAGKWYFSVGGSICDGCTDAAACNYNPIADNENASCCYTNCVSMILEDSFGDGWNGATYTILDLNTGYFVTSGSMADGSQMFQNLCLPEGCYSINVGGGSFDSEITYTVVGTNQGTLVATPADGEQTFSIGAGAVCTGCTDNTACNYNDIFTVDSGECCYDNCISLTMEDSFGDGWNGATWTIVDFNTGSGVATGTMEAAADNFKLEELCLADGCYTFVVGGGAFDSEISWTIDGGSLSGGPVSGGAPSETTFTVGAGQCYGCMDTAACNYTDDATVSSGCCYSTCVEIAMNDSGGDGWDGASYTITNYNTGIVFVSGSLTSGFLQIDDYCLTAGCYTIEFGGGGSDAEISIDLTYDGATFSGLAPGEYTFSTGGADCFGCMDSAACNYSPEATADSGLCCYANCLEMEQLDGFGDGWDDTIFTITDYNTGEVAATGTMESGSQAFENICLSDGCYLIEVGGGAFDSEVSWNLSGTNQGTISGGAPETMSFSVGTGECSGCTDSVACNYDEYALTDDGTCCYDNCVTFDMFDGFGDGWDSTTATLVDVNTGTIVLTTSLVEGLEGSEVWCLTTGCYELTVGGGAFDSEVSWTLTGVDGGPISGGAETIQFTVNGGVCAVTCLGDFDANGSINTADLLILLAEIGCSSGCATDMNGSGNVDTADILAFLALFGTDC